MCRNKNGEHSISFENYCPEFRKALNNGLGLNVDRNRVQVRMHFRNYRKKLAVLARCIRALLANLPRAVF